MMTLILGKKVILVICSLKVTSMCSVKNMQKTAWEEAFLTPVPVCTRTDAGRPWHSTLQVQAAPRAPLLHSCLPGERFQLQSYVFAATGRETWPGSNSSTESAGEKVTPSTKLCGHVCADTYRQARPTHACSTLSHFPNTYTLSFKDIFLPLNLFFLSNCSPEKVIILCFNTVYILPSISNWLLFIKVYFIKCTVKRFHDTYTYIEITNWFPGSIILLL